MAVLDILFLIIVVFTLVYPLIAYRLEEWKQLWRLHTRDRNVESGETTEGLS